VQTLTHEMKSPLAAIRGAAELLNEDSTTMGENDKKRFLENIHAEALRADRLLTRLLELSALEGKTKLEGAERIDFREVVVRAVAQAEPMADLAGVKLTTLNSNTPMMVCGDSFVLRAAVTNLLENAIDFSPKNQTVSIVLETLAGFHQVHISDAGEGIPEYAQDKVFERFFSLRHLRTGRKGTGLGLTLVKEAAELHLGKITLVKLEPCGTRATLEIPAA
jgi:two-component system, OmpR family, sensor histidine kinase CreC